MTLSHHTERLLPPISALRFLQTGQKRSVYASPHILVSDGPYDGSSPPYQKMLQYRTSASFCLDQWLPIGLPPGSIEAAHEVARRAIKREIYGSLMSRLEDILFLYDDPYLFLQSKQGKALKDLLDEMREA